MDSSPVITPAGTFAGQPVVLSLSRRVAARLRGAPLISLGILALLVFTAVFADFLAPHNPEVGNLRLKYRPPVWAARGSSEFILGTDHMGRDVLSRHHLWLTHLADGLCRRGGWWPGSLARPWGSSRGIWGAGWIR